MTVFEKNRRESVEPPIRREILFQSLRKLYDKYGELRIRIREVEEKARNLLEKCSELLFSDLLSWIKNKHESLSSMRELKVLYAYLILRIAGLNQNFIECMEQELDNVKVLHNQIQLEFAKMKSHIERVLTWVKEIDDHELAKQISGIIHISHDLSNTLKKTEELINEVAKHLEELKEIWSSFQPEVRMLCTHREWKFVDDTKHRCLICGEEEEHDFYLRKPGIQICRKCKYKRKIPLEH